jgi:hypothetical protein
VTVNERGGTDGRVLHQSLSCYTERLYPDTADLVGRRVLYKIDDGPGRLAEGMLADCRAHNVYLFPGVQNTTHVTQETDQNYGLFKPDIRRNIHILTSDLVTDYNRRLALYDLNREHNRPPPRTAAVDREYYGLLLSGRDANLDLGQSALAPAFYNAFSQTKNLRSWKVCGAVPLTREALRYHSVRHEVTRDATVPSVSNGVDGLHKPSVLLDDIISDESRLLIVFYLRYRRDTIVGACRAGLIWVFCPRIVPMGFLHSRMILFLCC